MYPHGKYIPVVDAFYFSRFSSRLARVRVIRRDLVDCIVNNRSSHEHNEQRRKGKEKEKLDTRGGGRLNYRLGTTRSGNVAITRARIISIIDEGSAFLRDDTSLYAEEKRKRRGFVPRANARTITEYAERLAGMRGSPTNSRC